MSNADLAQPEFPQYPLRGPHLLQLFAGDAFSVGKAGCKARERRLVPGVQVQLLRQDPHVGLRESCLPQRAADAHLGGRLQAGSEVCHVVGVGPVDNDVQPLLPCYLRQLLEELALAVVAAFRRVVRETIYAEFVRLYQPVAHANALRQSHGCVGFLLGVGLRFRRHCQHSISQYVVSHFHQKSAVDPG